MVQGAAAGRRSARGSGGWPGSGEEAALRALRAPRARAAAPAAHLAARGWGQRMRLFRVFSVNSALKMAVEVGLVVGTMPGEGYVSVFGGGGPKGASKSYSSR